MIQTIVELCMPLYTIEFEPDHPFHRTLAIQIDFYRDSNCTFGTEEISLYDKIFQICLMSEFS